jgi:hypothetical protein
MARQIEILDDGSAVISGSTGMVTDIDKKQYSEVENFTGEYWLTGEPIYRRTFIKTGPTAVDSSILVQLMTGVSKVFKIDVVCLNQNNDWIIGPVYYAGLPNLRYTVGISVDTATSVLYANIALSASATSYINSSFYITAYYVKTS